jgi:hypothetical protein
MAANYIAQKIEQAMSAVLTDAPLENRLKDAAIHLTAIADHDLVPLSEWAQKSHKKFINSFSGGSIQLQEAKTALGDFLLEAASGFEVAQYFKGSTNLKNN